MPGSRTLLFIRSVCGKLSYVWVVALLCGCLAGCGGSASPPAEPVAEAPPPEPPPAEAPPLGDPNNPPSAIVEEEEYNFGTAEVGQEFKHTFILKNGGPGPMEVNKGKPSCTTCTSFEVEDKMLPPGKSTKINVKWLVKAGTNEFRQFAPIYTNDPKHREIKFYVTGKIENRLVMQPAHTWELGDVEEGKPIHFKATLVSNLIEKFEAKPVETKNPLLKVELKPMDEERLKQVDAKCGYDIDVSLSPDIPVGDFRDYLTVDCYAPDHRPLRVDVNARRPGPVRIVGPSWNNSRMTLDLGTFDPAKGIKANLFIFTNGLSGELKFSSIKSKDDRLKLHLVQDQKFNGKGEKYKLTVEMVASPGKQAVMTYTDPLNVEIETNQPLIGTVNLKVVGRGL